MFPIVKEKGLTAVPRLVVFTSEDAHYSVKKLAAFLGIGTSEFRICHSDVQAKVAHLYVGSWTPESYTKSNDPNLNQINVYQNR